MIAASAARLARRPYYRRATGLHARQAQVGHGDVRARLRSRWRTVFPFGSVMKRATRRRRTSPLVRELAAAVEATVARLAGPVGTRRATGLHARRGQAGRGDVRASLRVGWRPKHTPNVAGSSGMLRALSGLPRRLAPAAIAIPNQVVTRPANMTTINPTIGSSMKNLQSP